MFHPRVATLAALSVVAVLPFAADARTTSFDPPSAPETLATGVLNGPDGRPASGIVQLTAWPLDPAKETQPTLLSARTDAKGRFRLATGDLDRLERLAARSQHGRLDFIAEGITSDGHQGLWVFSRSIRRVRDGATIRTAGTRAPLRAVVPPNRGTGDGSFRITARTPVPVTARAAVARAAALLPGDGTAVPARENYEACGIKMKPDKKQVRWAPVGELSNAGGGTRATFKYVNTADSDFSVAVSTGTGPFELNGSVNVSNTSEADITLPTSKRYARLIRSKFEFRSSITKQSVSACSGTRRVIRPTKWVGGLNTDVKLQGTLDVCDPKAPYTTTYPGGSAGVGRKDGRAYTYRSGFKAFGVGLDVTSGFSRTVSLRYTFGGSPKRKHYLCGSDGKTVFEANRVFSGKSR